MLCRCRTAIISTYCKNRVRAVVLTILTCGFSMLFFNIGLTRSKHCIASCVSLDNIEAAHCSVVSFRYIFLLSVGAPTN